MANVEFSLESLREASAELEAQAERVAWDLRHGIKFTEGQQLGAVFIDHYYIIGRIVYSEDFQEKVSFIPNGDWFGFEMESMG